MPQSGAEVQASKVQLAHEVLNRGWLGGDRSHGKSQSSDQPEVQAKQRFARFPMAGRQGIR